MKRILIVVVVFLFVLTALVASLQPRAEAQPAAVPAGDAVGRGKYLVAVAACNDCHTPFTLTPRGPEPDMTRMLSGHPAALKIIAGPKLELPWMTSSVMTNTAFAGPWGVSFAANLTPHKINGLGAVWDEARFIKAMRNGKHFGEARPILPPMPWQGYSQMTDEDLKAVWAYLQTVPPVDNLVPDAVMADLKP